MAFSNVYDAVDAAIRTYVLPRSGPPIATAARVLLALDGSVALPADDLAAALTNILASTGSGAALLPKTNIVSASSPVTTATVTAGTGKINETFYLTPAGTIAALTFVFPSNANSSIGQKLILVSHQIVTALTVSSSGLTLQGTAVTALAVDTPIIWQKVAASTWMRLL